MKSDKVITTKILEFKKILGDRSLHKKLMLEDDDKLHFIKKVRYVDDIPVCVEEIYMLIFGGAPVFEKWAMENGADGYSEDAASSVKLVRRLFEL